MWCGRPMGGGSVRSLSLSQLSKKASRSRGVAGPAEGKPQDGQQRVVCLARSSVSLSARRVFCGALANLSNESPQSQCKPGQRISLSALKLCHASLPVTFFFSLVPPPRLLRLTNPDWRRHHVRHQFVNQR